MRVCSNKITDEIRDLFGANPLKLPEARILPLCMIEVTENKPKYLGEFKYLVKVGFNHQLPIQESAVAQVSHTKTKAVDFNLGFNILGNFIKALGMDPAVVGLSVKGSKKMAFSFGSVTRRYIDVLQLGQILIENQIEGNPENPFLTGIFSNKNSKLALITDALQSKEFSISVYTENDSGANINIPLLQEYVAKGNLGIKVAKTAENEVRFAGETPLTYAFSCVELFLDANGRFSRGQWLENLRGAKELKKELTEAEIPKVFFDDNRANPMLIEL